MTIEPSLPVDSPTCLGDEFILSQFLPRLDTTLQAVSLSDSFWSFGGPSVMNTDSLFPDEWPALVTMRTNASGTGVMCLASLVSPIPFNSFFFFL